MENIVSLTLALSDGRVMDILNSDIKNIKLEGMKECFRMEPEGFLEYRTCDSFRLEFLPSANRNHISPLGEIEEKVFELLKQYSILSINFNHMDTSNTMAQSSTIFVPYMYLAMEGMNKTQERSETPDGGLVIKTGKECEIIDIRYTDEELIKLEYIEGKSDWIDLRAAEDVTLKAGESRLISLGVAIRIPEGFEGHITPRSSTLKNFGVIQGNHLGIVDASYSGNADILRFSAYALRDTEIKFNDRICQFRIVKNQPEIIFNEKKELEGPNRGGFGTTGKR